MIIKNKDTVTANSPQTKAGVKQEKDVAFYLRREFSDHEQIFVFNDFSFSFKDENAQIDHLILYPYGFILIESKSIQGEVTVNHLGEWSRTVNRKWAGMPSPIQQVELQKNLLLKLLDNNAKSILPKLLGLKHQTFNRRCWDMVCAVSSHTVLNRDAIPTDIGNKIFKSEFLIPNLIKTMNIKSSLASTFSFDSRPAFSADELTSIVSFLVPLYDKVAITEIESESPSDEGIVTQKIIMSCKKCDNQIDLSPAHGRYGYFVKCSKCETNTSMKKPCHQCQSKNTKVSKSGNNYSLVCSECKFTSAIFP